MDVAVSLQNGRYSTLEEVGTDLELMFENAKRYNMDESKIYKVRSVFLFTSQRKSVIVLPFQIKLYSFRFWLGYFVVDKK